MKWLLIPLGVVGFYGYVLCDRSPRRDEWWQQADRIKREGSARRSGAA